MKKRLFLLKWGIKVSKIDWNNYAIACLQLNALRSELLNAVVENILTLEDYNDFSKAIEETKENIKKGIDKT